MRTISTVFVLSVACLATAWPALAQDGSGAVALEGGPGLSADISPVTTVPPLGLRPLDTRWGCPPTPRGVL